LLQARDGRSFRRALALFIQLGEFSERETGAWLAVGVPWSTTMTHHHPALSLYYRVELSPEAWREVGCVPGEEFQVLQDLMTLFAAEGTPYELGEGPHSVTVAGFEVQYLRDDAERILTLLRVTRARPRDPEEIE
jgi:hypothetical protein